MSPYYCGHSISIGTSPNAGGGKSLHLISSNLLKLTSLISLKDIPQVGEASHGREAQLNIGASWAKPWPMKGTSLYGLKQEATLHV